MNSAWLPLKSTIDSEVEGDVGAVGKEGNFLRRAVLEDLEILLRQIRNQAAGAIVDGEADIDEMNVGSERSVLGGAERRNQTGCRRGKAHTDILRAARRGGMQEWPTLKAAGRAC